jgi:hypothetical protein
MGGPPVVPLMGVRTSRLRVRGGGAVETIRVHPSLLGHSVRTRVRIHGMNTHKERERRISVTTAWRDRTVEMWHHTSTRARATTTNAG